MRVTDMRDVNYWDFIDLAIGQFFEFQNEFYIKLTTDIGFNLTAECPTHFDEWDAVRPVQVEIQIVDD